MSKIDYLVRPLFTEIAKRMNLSLEQFIYCSMEEIENYFRNRTFPDKKRIEKRKNKYALLVVDGKIFVECDIKEETQNGVRNTNSVNGTVAQAGKVIGTARIVLDATQIGKMKQGDILIADMTNPDLLPAINLASGLITNRGGTLCHAAILSRELKKPCLIGTSNATEVFQDGDRITLDTSKGIAYKLESKKLNQEEWVHLGQWVQPPLSACFWNNWTQHNEKYPFKIDQMDGRLLFLHGHHFVRKSDIEVLRKFIKKNANNFEILKALEKWIDDVHNNCKSNITKGFDSLSQAMKVMKEECNNIVNPWIFFLILDSILEEEIQKICNENGYNFDEVVKMIKPVKKSFTVLQSEEATLLHDKIKGKEIPLDFEQIKQADESLAQEISNHVKKFEFVGVHHFVGEPYSVKRFLESKPAKFVEEAKRDIPIELQWHIKLASIAAWARTHMAETSGLIQNTMKPVNQKLNFDDDEYLYLTATELINALENPTFVKPNIQKRKDKVGIYSDSINDEIIVEDVAVDSLIEEILPKKQTSSFPLTGRIASQGKVNGIARIVVRPEDISKVADGDILIAPETSPDFVAGLKRAAGVITNQGGITSHAAIVSREFGIPCLVGVEGATSIIKDGQRIELDALTGEVRSLD
jgi:phosphohistidine swiveling domain-containing protein